MDTKTRILEAAAELLARSPDADVSTRAVCEAAGIGAPILYRQFGDKEGLLSAVVDYGFEQYLAGKRSAVPSADPVQDLRDGWDNHVGFAVENPNYYRLMYSPGLSAPPEAAAEAQRLLRLVVERVAAAGRLRLAPETAVRMVMSANTGVALSLISRPALYPDQAFSDRVRDAVIASIVVDEPSDRVPPPAATAAMLGAQLRADPPTSLTGQETALLHQWLDTLADS